MQILVHKDLVLTLRLDNCVNLIRIQWIIPITSCKKFKCLKQFYLSYFYDKNKANTINFE